MGLMVSLEHEPYNRFIYKNDLSHLNIIKPWQTDDVFFHVGSGAWE